MKLYFGNAITIKTTILIVGIICYMIFLIRKRDNIKHWGRQTLLLAAWGLFICVEAATRDAFHLTVENAINSSVAPGVFSLISFPTIIGAMGALVVILSGIISIFLRKQSSKEKFCYIVMGAIMVKIVVIEISRIILI